MRFGKIHKVLLLGGGRLLALAACRIRERGLEVYVLTSTRRYEEACGDKLTLESFLKKNGIGHLVTTDCACEEAVSQITKETLGISMGAPWLFKSAFIERFAGRLLNCHGSRLPMDRGGGGFSWRIMRRDIMGACLLHIVDTGIDTGPIVKYEEFTYPPSCRRPIDYYDYSLEKNLLFLEKFFDEVSSENDFQPISQQESFSTYFPRLATDINGMIDWSWRARDIEAFICAFDDPYKGASTYLDKEKVRLKDCFLIAGEGDFHPYQSGIIYRISSNGVYVAAQGGGLLIKRIENEDCACINDRIKVGDRFFTPTSDLDRAKGVRAAYTPEGLKVRGA